MVCLPAAVTSCAVVADGEMVIAAHGVVTRHRRGPMVTSLNRERTGSSRALQDALRVTLTACDMTSSCWHPVNTCEETLR